MGFLRQAFSRNFNKQKLIARLKVAALILGIVLMITPLRNRIMPACLWNNSWNDLNSLKLIRIHLFDLFYYIDRSPYKGSCEHIRRHLSPLKKIKPEELRVFTEEEFNANLEKIKWKFTAEELWKVQHFKPSISADEQREMLYSTLILAQAFDIFNVSYFMAEGTLIGVYRHHGFIPWDDDVDLMIKADQWALAREVLSCIPGFSLNMGRDFMWKFMWNKSQFWRNEDFIRFPYIDVFPYNEDSQHLWPLTIWMKRDVIWTSAHAYPKKRLPLEGFLVSVPGDAPSILTRHYGPNVNTECASRIFQRKERIPFPHSERVRVPCSFLYELYPFVFQQKDPNDGSEIHVRKEGDKILSTFKLN